LTTSMHLRLFQLHLWLLRLHLRLLQLHLRPLWLHLQLLRLHLRLLRLHLRLYFRLFQLYLCTAAFVLSLQRDLPVVSGLECLRVDESAVAFPTDYGMAEWKNCKHNINGIYLAGAAANMQECLPPVPHPSQSAKQISFKTCSFPGHHK
jgi:hypothetical protein